MARPPQSWGKVKVGDLELAYDVFGTSGDPLTADAKFLPWLASWVGFQLDESLPVHQQRELVRRAIRLMRTRGTRLGIEEMVRVLTSAPVRPTTGGRRVSIA